MVESAMDERFNKLTKMKGRHKLKRQRQDFALLTSPAQELFLQAHSQRLFSPCPCLPSDFEKLVALGYISSNQLDDARISISDIIEWNLRQEYVAIFTKELSPMCQPSPGCLEAMKAEDMRALSKAKEHGNSFFSFVLG